MFSFPVSRTSPNWDIMPYAAFLVPKKSQVSNVKKSGFCFKMVLSVGFLYVLEICFSNVSILYFLSQYYFIFKDILPYEFCIPDNFSSLLRAQIHNSLYWRC